MPKNVKPNLKEKNVRNISVDDSSLCVVCYRKAEIFSIGECDHPVCYECSTRMRVLCQRTECPICRKDMAMVVFTHNVQLFKSILHQHMKCERRYCIYFSDDEIMKAYDTLLQHSCSECENHEIFKNFNFLKDHMRKVHGKFYCELCVENLRIFTHERKCYNRSLLAQHRRIGDDDDKSHRGHPLCEFCDSRFMDKDELFRHLRRDHFFCHFCDADGVHQYYEDYDALREHFRSGHFLCEEGTCIDERFTSVFRTKLDLQVHTTHDHGHTMTKTEARQARTVDIAFTVNHRQGHFSDRGRGGRRGEGRGRRPQDLEEQASAAAAIPPSENVAPVLSRAIDINCVQDFPSLNGVGGTVTDGDSGGGGASNTKSIAHKLAQQNRFTIRTTRGHALDEEEFPSLGSTSTSVSLSSATSNTKTSHATSNPSTSLHFSVNTKKNINSGSQINSGSNVSIHYNSMNSTPNASYSDTGISRAGKGKPRIGNVSHSGNITVRSAPPTGARPKSAQLEEDFPMLQPASKPFVNNVQTPNVNVSWGSNSLNKSLVSKAPKKPVNGTDSAINNKKNNNDNIDGSKDSHLPNKYVYESQDFPSLAPSSGNLDEKLSYSGRSSLTIPMKKPLQTKEAAKDKILENDENVGGKGKKKKKNISSKVNTIDNDKIAVPTTVPKSVKKKPLQLSNAFENANPDEPMEDFSRGRIGEYEAVVPMLSSNIKVISSVDEMTGNSPKKSELQIGQLKTPDFSAEEFPSLGFGPVPSKGSKATSKLVRSLELPNNSSSSWNQNSKSSKKQFTEPPGFANNSSTSVPPGFANTKMTFTSSLGQNFAISPSSETPQKSLTNSSKPPCKEKRKMLKPPVFILPPNFEQRNNALIDAIRAGCDGNDDKFNKFKNLAAVFRTGQIQGQQYYEKCKQIMGKSMFHSILPELLVLLPDIGKQQEVFDAYRKMDGGQGCQTCFAVCAVCQQVLISEDFSLHMTKHEFSTENYPTLLKTSEKTQQGRK
ncbi:UNVERIFIED_CONTAM: hypothetical protein RMT77_009146 [Armadillidium vulgare]